MAQYDSLDRLLEQQDLGTTDWQLVDQPRSTRSPTSPGTTSGPTWTRSGQPGKALGGTIVHGALTLCAPHRLSD
jgi:hypothetical protein